MKILILSNKKCSMKKMTSSASNSNQLLKCFSSDNQPHDNNQQQFFMPISHLVTQNSQIMCPQGWDVIKISDFYRFLKDTLKWTWHPHHYRHCERGVMKSMTAHSSRLAWWHFLTATKAPHIWHPPPPLVEPSVQRQHSEKGRSESQYY